MSSPTIVNVIGGQGGGPFSFTGEKNCVRLEKIGVWVGEWQVKAVKVWLSDDRSQTFGVPAGPYQEYVFQPGECFTSLSLWNNVEGTRLGAIKFRTNKGGNFFAKMTVQPLTTEYSMDVGSGYCLGVVGRCGSDIDCMGFMFLKAVQSTVLTNVNYPTINQLKPVVAMEEIKFVSLSNNSPVIQQEIIQSSKKITKPSSWSLSASFAATFSVEVKAGILEVREGPNGYVPTVGPESIYQPDQTTEKNETSSTIIDVPPKKKVDVSIAIGKTSFDLPYTGTVMITCKNGSVLQYETEGKYKGVSYTDNKVKTTESNI